MGNRDCSGLVREICAVVAAAVTGFDHTIDSNFSRPYFLSSSCLMQSIRDRRNYARDQKFQMDAPFNPYDQCRDRVAVRARLAAKGFARAKIELYAGGGQRKFFRCPQSHERGKAWSDETTGGFAGRTL